MGSPVAAGHLADQIAAAAAGCPGVAALADGPVATYLPGRRVPGVAVRGGRVQVVIVARYGMPLALIADAVRSAVAVLADGRPVDVLIDDLAPDGQTGRAGRTG